jgi:flagellar biosynthesis protein FlhA
LQRVLQNLLRENVSIRDLPLILEALGEHGPRSKNAGVLTEFVRKSLIRAITEQNQGSTGIQAITLEPSLEHYLIGQVNQTADGVGLSIEPDTASALSQQFAESWRAAMDKGAESVAVLCDARIRAGLYHLIQRSIRRLPVLAYDEIVQGTVVDIISTVSVSSAFASADSPVGATA